MNVVVNGKARAVDDATTVSDLVAELGLTERNVVVELNREPLDRARYAAVRLSPGDVVEVVRAVAGG
jgi:sulfur carrier protein